MSPKSQSVSRQKHLARQAVLIQKVLASKKFRAWTPVDANHKTSSRGESKSFAYKGPNFTAVGPSFRNQGEPTKFGGNGTELAIEKHFTPSELAKTWGLSVDTIRELFENEPGVMVIARPETRLKRRYRTFRVPQSVAVRVHTRLASKG
jgi:hypothetical protein